MAQQLLLRELQRKVGWRTEITLPEDRECVAGMKMCILQLEQQVVTCYQTRSDYGP